MTAKMNNSFINYVDFVDVSLEALETAPRKLFTKMMHMIISTLHIQSVEIQKYTLEVEDMNLLPVDDLNEFYDNILDNVEDLKLLKKRLNDIKDKDELFDELIEQVDKLHFSFVQYMDKMGQLEVRILSQKRSA